MTGRYTLLTQGCEVLVVDTQNGETVVIEDILRYDPMAKYVEYLNGASADDRLGAVESG